MVSSSFRKLGIIGLTFLILGLLLAPGCEYGEVNVSNVAELEAQGAVEWMELLCNSVKAEKLSPPVASRIYAYAGVTLYESVVGGMPGYQSLGGQLNYMPDMPQPESGQAYDWPASMSAALAVITARLFESASPATLTAFLQLRSRQLADRVAEGVKAEVIDRSVIYGERVAGAILEWADTDGYMTTRGLSYTAPSGPGTWEPTPPNFAPPAEPYWGELRTFTEMTAVSCPALPPVPYSEQPGSEFYLQAKATYDAVNDLSDEQETIALFWADNPAQTFTPPGHWLSIENQMVEQLDMLLGGAAEMYALVGIALADAFCTCWHTKYEWSVVRPITYIQRYIDAGWEPILATPAFPEYTSGHSVASGAAATVLTSLLGAVPFTDKTHEEMGLTARYYSSFNEAAEEAAISRLYGGIHYPMAIENGLTQGVCVGQWVIDHAHTRR